MQGPLSPFVEISVSRIRVIYRTFRILLILINLMQLNDSMQEMHELNLIGEFKSIPSLELVHDQDSADALRRQLIMYGG